MLPMRIALAETFAASLEAAARARLTVPCEVVVDSESPPANAVSGKPETAPPAHPYSGQGLIPSSFAAVSPSMARRSALVKPGAFRMWSTDLACHGIG